MEIKGVKGACIAKLLGNLKFMLHPEFKNKTRNIFQVRKKFLTSVEDRSFVMERLATFPNTFITNTQRPEILCCLRDYVIVQLKNNTTS